MRGETVGCDEGAHTLVPALLTEPPTEPRRKRLSADRSLSGSETAMGGPPADRLGMLRLRLRSSRMSVALGPARSASLARAALLSARNCRMAASLPSPFLPHMHAGVNKQYVAEIPNSPPHVHVSSCFTAIGMLSAQAQLHPMPQCVCEACLCDDGSAHAPGTVPGHAPGGMQYTKPCHARRAQQAGMRTW